MDDEEASARRCLDGGGTLGMLNLAMIRHVDGRKAELKPLTSMWRPQGCLRLAFDRNRNAASKS